MDRLDGRTAFITGGAQGIGLGIARALAPAGVVLALADVDEDALGAAREELSAHTVTQTFVLDVRDRERFAVVADEVEDRLGPVTLLFNNAGVAGGAPVSQMTYEMWDWILGVNLMGVVNGIQTFIPRMIARGGNAHVVNTASGAGLVVVGAGAMYTTSKFGVVGLSESLRAELESHQIGVSVLCPAFVATDIVVNSAALSPSGGRARDSSSATEDRSRTFKAKGASPDAVGEMVVDAVTANRLYIYTDGMIAKPLERRARQLLDAVPVSIDPE